MISFATTNGPILLCFAKKMITLSLAIYVLILLLTVLLTMILMKEPSIKCRSSVDRCGASELTTNLSIFSVSR
jgi:hypothetical protein